MGLKWVEMHPTPQHVFLACRDENVFILCLSCLSVRNTLCYNLLSKEHGACGDVVG
jgi:hypothetical protein